MHLSELAAACPLAQRAAASLRQHLRQFAVERMQQGLAPPPPITVLRHEEGDEFTAKFVMAPGNRQAILLSHALERTLECSSAALEQEDDGVRITFRADELTIVLSAPKGVARCCTLEVSATEATLGHATWLVARAFSLAHTLSIEAEGSTGIKPPQ